MLCLATSFIFITLNRAVLSLLGLQTNCTLIEKDSPQPFVPFLHLLFADFLLEEIL